MTSMSKNRAKSPRRLPRRSYMLLFSWRFAEVSPAGNRAAPAGETHFPDLNSCGARTELAATPALRCGQSAERKLEGPPVLDFPRSGGICSACRSAVAARRDGPQKKTFRDRSVRGRRGRRRTGLFLQTLHGVHFNGATKPEHIPPAPLLMHRAPKNQRWESFIIQTFAGFFI